MHFVPSEIYMHNILQGCRYASACMAIMQWLFSRLLLKIAVAMKDFSSEKEGPLKSLTNVIRSRPDAALLLSLSSIIAELAR